MLPYSSYILYFSHAEGEVLMVQPENMEDTVKDFIKLLNLNPERMFTLESTEPGISIMKHIHI